MGGGELEHFHRAFRVRADASRGNAVEAVGANSNEGAGDDRHFAAVWAVLIVVFNDGQEILIGLVVIMRHAFAIGVHLAELPLGQRLASGGSIFQRFERDFGIAIAQAFQPGAQSGLRIFEDGQRHGFGGGFPLRRIKREGRCGDDHHRQASQSEKGFAGQTHARRRLRTEAEVRTGFVDYAHVHTHDFQSAFAMKFPSVTRGHFHLPRPSASTQEP